MHCRGLSPQDTARQSAWRARRRGWTLQVATLLSSLPSLPDTLRAAQHSLSASASAAAAHTAAGSSLSVGEMASSPAASRAVVAATAAAAAAQVGATLRLAVLAEMLLSLRVVAAWQLPPADAAKLRWRLVPEVCSTPGRNHDPHQEWQDQSSTPDQ